MSDDRPRTELERIAAAYEVERTRADAAEAQRDRLAAALREIELRAFTEEASVTDAMTEGVRVAFKLGGIAEGYKAGRIAALREVRVAIHEDGHNGVPAFYGEHFNRLLAEAESGEQTGEVGYEG